MSLKSFASAKSVNAIEHILTTIHETRHITVRELSRELEMAPRTVNSYLQYMADELHLIHVAREANPRRGDPSIWAMGVKSEDSDVEPVRLRTLARQIGAVRPWYLAMLFGPAGVVA